MKRYAAIALLAVAIATHRAGAADPQPYVVNLPATGQAALDTALRHFADQAGRKLGQVAQPLRAALTGSTMSPGIDETLAALGREEALARIALAAA